MLDETRLDFLLEAYVDQTLSAEERAELEMQLMASDEARRRFWEKMHGHAAAREWAFRSAAGRMVGGTPAPVKKMAALSRWRPAVVLAGIAAGLAILLAVGLGIRKPEKPVAGEPGKPVALLALSADAEWEGVSLSAGSPLYAGPIRLGRGSARIDFLSGAQMTVKAPVEVVLVDDLKADLLSGIVRVFAPPAAKGFTVVAGDLTVVDQGTEFGVTASAGQAGSVHVFSGRVDVGETGNPGHQIEVTSGRAVKWESGVLSHFDADPGLFPGNRELAGAMREEQARRHAGWLEKSASFLRSHGAVIHYTFDDDGSGSGSQVTNNVDPALPGTNGTIVGAERVSGRWDGKAACSFSRSTDRVRFVVPGSYRDLTLMAWVRVDRLPNQLNVLLRGDEASVGTAHWQFDSEGCLRLGVMTPEKVYLKPGTDIRTEWDVAVSPPLLRPKLGQWVHVASVYDSRRSVIEHFVDGRRVDSHPLRKPLPLVIGPAQIGNTENLDREGASQVNFVGRIDEFTLLETALGEAEIRQCYETGKP